MKHIMEAFDDAFKEQDKIRETTKNISCNGCRSIKEARFPFTDHKFFEDSDGKYYIDQEGRGVNRETYLEIHFCPVCGKVIE